MPKINWKPVVSFPAQLTVRLEPEVINAGDAWPWCESKAADLLGSDADRRDTRHLAVAFIKHIEAIRGLGNKVQPVVAALSFWPDFTMHRGSAEVFMVADDHPRGPITLTAARDLARRDEETLGRTETAEVKVPAGPALRAHRFRTCRGAPARKYVREEVSWFIRPVGSRVTVIMTVCWFERLFSEAGSKIADDMARSLRLQPLD